MTQRFRRQRDRSAGFSLVEILVVMVIMGLVVSAIMSLYVNMQRTSGSSEEVIEVQQGLRIALDRIALDLRMAGFLVTGPPLDAAGPNSITIHSATTRNQYARIDAQPASPASGVLTLAIKPEEMALMFDTGDKVRIVDPTTGCLMITNNCTDASVGSISSASSGLLKIDLTGASFAGIELRVLPEAMVVRADDAGVYPNTITYELADDPDKPGSKMLVRRVNQTGSPTAAETATQTMVGKISSLEFTYSMDDGTALTTVPTARLDEIRKVQVVMTAETIDTKNSSGVKVREAGTSVKLRNR